MHTDIACRPLYLPQHVYACGTDDGVVFLDTRHDRYFGLGGENIRALPEVIRNWPDRSFARNSEAPPLSGELQQVTNALLEQGLLARGADTDLPRARGSVPPLNIDPPTLTAASCRSTRPGDVANFAVACTKAAWSLKWRSLESIASGLRTRRVAAGTAIQRDVDTALELAQIFRHLRSCVFSEKNRCLLNALSLVYFLSSYGHFPLFVIGVKTGPFAAHSWVQQDRIVLDGDPANVCHFVPILAA